MTSIDDWEAITVRREIQERDTKRRGDFAFEIALFWNEEDEFNRQRLHDRSRSLRIVTLFQSI